MQRLYNVYELSKELLWTLMMRLLFVKGRISSYTNDKMLVIFAVECDHVMQVIRR